MNETHKFKDSSGDTMQGIRHKELISMHQYGQPWLTTEQARQFAIQLIKLANEIEATQ